MVVHNELAELPLSRPYDLSDLGAGGAELRISASTEELLRLAGWLAVSEVRALLFATIRTFHMGGWRQTMVAAPHVPLGRRGLSLGNRHGGVYSFIGPNQHPP